MELLKALVEFTLAAATCKKEEMETLALTRSLKCVKAALNQFTTFRMAA